METAFYIYGMQQKKRKRFSSPIVLNNVKFKIDYISGKHVWVSMHEEIHTFW